MPIIYLFLQSSISTYICYTAVWLPCTLYTYIKLLTAYLKPRLLWCLLERWHLSCRHHCYLSFVNCVRRWMSSAYTPSFSAVLTLLHLTVHVLACIVIFSFLYFTFPWFFDTEKGGILLFRVYICYYNLHSILYTKSQIVISQVLISPLNF